MKTILCYGDSNTWGSNPLDGSRFDIHTRWPGVMRDYLGDEYWVIEEGLCGRTTVWDDPLDEGRNGRTYLFPCLESHKPIDLVILILGTNDLKGHFKASPEDIASGVDILVNIIQLSQCGVAERAPRVLLVAPPKVGKLSEFALSFEGARKKSKLFGEFFRQVADLHGCDFLDASMIIKSSPLDGIHFDAEAHRILGKTLGEMVLRILG